VSKYTTAARTECRLRSRARSQSSRPVNQRSGSQHHRARNHHGGTASSARPTVNCVQPASGGVRLVSHNYQAHISERGPGERPICRRGNRKRRRAKHSRTITWDDFDDFHFAAAHQILRASASSCSCRAFTGDRVGRDDPRSHALPPT